MIEQPQRAMQGGVIEGDERDSIANAAKALNVLIMASILKAGDIPVEHHVQEAASIAMQALCDEAEPVLADFLEGALTQLGWQVGIRAGSKRKQRGAWIQQACGWMANGFNMAGAEPLVAEPPSEGKH